MKVFHVILISVFLAGCGLASQPVTSTPAIAGLTSIPSLTSTPDKAATQKAILAMTQTAYANNINVQSTEKAASASTAIARLSAILEETKNTSDEVDELDISAAKLYFGPAAATLRRPGIDTITTYDSNLFLKNFIVTVTFVNPEDISAGDYWDYGILFRNNYGNDQYRLVIQSDQIWSLLNANTWMNIYDDEAGNLNTLAGESNSIWLVVIDEKAFLFINNTYVRTLSVKAKSNNGDVSLATGLDGEKRTKSAIEFYDFTVWSLH